MQLKNKNLKKSFADSHLSFNELYDCTRRAVISYFARNYAYGQGYQAEDFEYVMLFVKRAYIAFYKELEDAQKGNL